MKIHDISMTIRPEMAVYKNRDAKRPKFVQSAWFDTQGVYETDITFNLHTGTHVDFPLHTLPGGATSDVAKPGDFIGTALVVDCTDVIQAITKADLEHAAIQEDDWVLLKTRNSAVETFDFEFVYLAKDAAEYLVSKRIRGVGIDALGIERNQPNHPTHDALLGNGIYILEGLRLQTIEPKRYSFLGVPLKLAGVEAAPLRAVLLEE
jgi:arylformamidase